MTRVKVSVVARLTLLRITRKPSPVTGFPAITAALTAAQAGQTRIGPPYEVVCNQKTVETIRDI